MVIGLFKILLKKAGTSVAFTPMNELAPEGFFYLVN